MKQLLPDQESELIGLGVEVLKGIVKGIAAAITYKEFRAWFERKRKRQTKTAQRKRTTKSKP